MRSFFGPLPALLLAALLAAGFAFPWAVLVVAAEDGVREFDADSFGDHLLLRADGTPIIQRLYYRRDRGRMRAPEMSFRDLAGRPIALEEKTEWLKEVSLAPGRESFFDVFLAQDESWDYRILKIEDRRDPDITWYFICDGLANGSAYLTAYDTERATRLGYLGTAGFRSDRLPPEEHFPFDGADYGIYRRIHNLGQEQFLAYRSSNAEVERARTLPPSQLYVQCTDDRVYLLDLEGRTAKVALEGAPIRSTGLFERSGIGPEARRMFLAVRTDDTVLLLAANNTIVRRFPIPINLRDQAFYWFETPDGGAVTERYVGQTSGTGESSVEIAWYDAGGGQIAHEMGSLQETPRREMPLAIGIRVPMPIAQYWLAGVQKPREVLYVRPGESYAAAFGQSLAEYWLPLVLVHLLAAVLAGLCYRRQVRYGTSMLDRVVWPLFVFVFGVPGWVGYRYGRSWPALARCPKCGRAVPQDREACAACGQEFPLPELRGIEVFA